MSNPTLGVIDCPTCSTPGAEVRQTKRRGARLYWQCSECGLNQPTGANIQATLWQQTQWSEGAAPLRPGNVSSEPKEAETLPEFDPNETQEEATQASAAQPKQPQGRGRGVGLLMLGAVGLGVLLSIN